MTRSGLHPSLRSTFNQLPSIAARPAGKARCYLHPVIRIVYAQGRYMFLQTGEHAARKRRTLSATAWKRRTLSVTARKRRITSVAS
jgi:hypothetical protein